jgi:type IV pilus assembly protein PilA
MKINSKGFTLIELLAVLVILGLLVALAVPNVTGVVRRQRNSTYVEDAKRLGTRLKTVHSINPDLKSGCSSSSACCFSLRYLDNGDFDQGPNSGYYLKDYSYVKYNGSTYYVTLIECVSCKTQAEADALTSYSGKDIRGVKLTSFASLTTSKPEDVIGTQSELNGTNFTTSKRSDCPKTYFHADQDPK